MKNKKGQLLGETPALIVTTLIVIILLVVFFLFIRITGGTAPEAKPAMLEEQNLVSLKAYLSTPIVIQEQEMQIADLIRLAKINSSYTQVLEEKTKEILGKVYGTDYELEIKGLLLISYRTPPPLPEPAVAIKEEYVSETVKIAPDIEVRLGIKNE